MSENSATSATVDQNSNGVNPEPPFRVYATKKGRTPNTIRSKRSKNGGKRSGGGRPSSVVTPAVHVFATPGVAIGSGPSDSAVENLDTSCDANMGLDSEGSSDSELNHDLGKDDPNEFNIDRIRKRREIKGADGEAWLLWNLVPA